jgi:hypothetical protein
MSTNQQRAIGWLWAWVGVAFIVGIVVGFAACVGTIIVLQVMTSYVP